MGKTLMDYEKFLKSLDNNTIHFLNEECEGVLNKKILEPHYLISSSGSNSRKQYLHSLSSLCFSAEAVNKHYSLSESDCWLQTLSTKHIGGFSINVRSMLAKMRPPVKMNWDPLNLENILLEEKVTVLSLVPTQVFDLISYGVKAPHLVKHAFVGGAAISKDVYDKAIQLGWPLRLCFGMTETGAQMSYSMDGKSYQPYEGWEFLVGEDQRLVIKGEGLFSYQLIDGLYVENKESWYKTTDLVTNQSGSFTFKGRAEALLKRKGAFENFDDIKNEFEKILLKNNFKRSDFELIAVEDKRNEVSFFVVSEQKGIKGIKAFNILKIKGFIYLDSIPRGALNKVKVNQLSDILKKKILFY